MNIIGSSISQVIATPVINTILLQAAIAAGFLLVAIFFIFMIGGTIVLSKLFIRMFLKNRRNSANTLQHNPYILIPWIVSVSISLALSALSFYMFVLLLDMLLGEQIN
jgi:heme/copper-type cytochrome/quinol oxidase subunit 2